MIGDVGTIVSVTAWVDCRLISVNRRGLSAYCRSSSSASQVYGVSAYRRIGVSVFRRIGVSAFRRIGVSADRCFGVSAFRRFGVSALRLSAIHIYEPHETDSYLVCRLRLEKINLLADTYRLGSITLVLCM